MLMLMLSSYAHVWARFRKVLNLSISKISKMHNMVCVVYSDCLYAACEMLVNVIA